MEVPKEFFHMGNEWFWSHLFRIHFLGSIQPHERSMNRATCTSCSYDRCISCSCFSDTCWACGSFVFHTQANAWGFTLVFFGLLHPSRNRKEHEACWKTRRVRKATALSAVEFLGLSLVHLSVLGALPFSYPSLPGKCQGLGKTKVVSILKSSMERRMNPSRARWLDGR